ncbi:hypothetical protein NL676_010905 [Syzygium grande]|nr:hypothetical protein NL676_010905 [Syzygium grande]
MRSGPLRRADTGAIAETHVADGALSADKNREIGDGKDHRAIRQFRLTSSFHQRQNQKAESRWYRAAMPRRASSGVRGEGE